ncbi:MAG: acetate--CoA ligase family protein [Candidatus Bathyarchaeota archaeon]|nr:acetate--CoA ligase family protein [Candidatus Bathyarchaeota archaeon]
MNFDNTTNELLTNATNQKIKVLSLDDSRKIMIQAGIPFNRYALARSQNEATNIAKEIGFPVVMKIVSPQIIHKTDVDGVKININSEIEVKSNYIQMINRVREVTPVCEIKGISIEEMVKGPEFIIGTVKDSQFGPMIMFGVGGIFVEVYKDVTFRLIPISETDAKDMLNELRGKELLNGIRGMPKGDPNELADILIRVSKLMERYKQIKEIDINPLILTVGGAKAVDARIILE